jgi:ribonuclease HI
MASAAMARCIEGWRVGTEDSMSDHKYIHFDLNVSLPEPSVGRNLHKANWTRFKTHLEEIDWGEPYRWSPHTLELETARLYDHIKEALDASCPETALRPKRAKVRWWSKNVESLRRKMRTSYDTYRQSRTWYDQQIYKADRRELKKEIRKAKAQSWKHFCSDISSEKSMAKLTKVIRRTENKNLGILKDSQGRMCKGPEDSMQVLMATHFPGSTMVTEQVVSTQVRCTKAELNNFPYIDLERVKAALNMFGPDKAAGQDAIKPVILQNLPDNIINRMTILYRACLAMGYTPLAWRLSRAVFIPKPGKDDYGQAKSFRPISLMSYIFKAFERTLLWELEGTYLQLEPLNRNQHAFRAGHSTDSALSEAVDTIEQAITRNEYAMGSFMDIDGAFDNLDPAAVIEGLERKGLPPSILAWFNHYLRNRTVTVTIKGVSATRMLHRGTPQGGVLSPLLWNVAFERLLEMFNQGPVRAIGFADDLLLLVRGIHLASMRDQMQRAIIKADKWAAESALTFSVSKSVAVIFTRRRKWTPPLPMVLRGQNIQYVDTVRYLGVTLDQKLNWNIHVHSKINNAKGLLLKMRQAVGTLWGPEPRYIRWAYNCVVRPALTYGSVVWHAVTQKKGIQEQLNKVQRLAGLMTAPMRRSTPTAGIEVIMHLMPLDIYILGEALKTMSRITEYTKDSWDGLGTGQFTGHRRWLKDRCREIGLYDFPTDRITPRIKWTRGYTVDKESFLSGKAEVKQGVFTCFTDGSKLDETVGLGYLIKTEDGTLLKESIFLGKMPTVFQAEVAAILRVGQELSQLELQGRDINIYSDSQAALLALNNPYIKSKTVLECANILDCLGSRVKVSLYWVRAHVGTEGNEEADRAANEGRTEVQLGPEPFLPVPLTYIHNLIKGELTQRWNQRWKTLTTCRQTKNWFPVVDQRRSMTLINKSKRADYGVVIQFITGHNHLRRHEALVTPGLDKMCRLCNEKEETSFHLATECPRVRSYRSEAFRTSFVQVVNEQGEPVRVDINVNITNDNMRPTFSIEWTPTGMLEFLGTIGHLFGENS